MKKSRLLLVIALAIVLVVTCVSFPTFSWYSRSNSLNGETLAWSSSQKVYDGSGITFKTYYSSDGQEYGSTEIDSYDYTIDPGERAYFRTDINNTTDAEQNVSLYISELTLLYEARGSNLFIGVNGPLRTHKPFVLSNASRTTTKNASTINQKYVYIGFKHGTLYDPTNVGVYYWGDNNLSGNSRVGNVFVTDNWENGGVRYDIYTATIPYEATKYIVGKWSYKYACVDMNDKYSDDVYYPNNNTYLLDPSNSYSGWAGQSSSSAAIQTFYSSAEIASNQGTYSISATGTGTLTYSSSNESVATVDNSGNITPVSPGTATITVTSTGANSDRMTATCDLEIFSTSDQTYYNVPLATNYVINSAVGNIPSTASVYWYVENQEDATAVLTYNIKSLYLGL